MAKFQPRIRRANWLLPLAFALPVFLLAAAALLLWGNKLREIIGVVLKLAVIA